MSFLKITDPSKRAHIVDEYLKLKKSIQQNSLSEKLGDSDLQRDLIKLYKPITESQAGIAKELSDTSTVLKALPASISSSLQAIMPAGAIEDPVESVRTLFFGDLAEKYIGLDKNPAVKTFGISLEKGKFYIGPTEITIQGNDVTVGGKTYIGTPGLWELLAMSNPDKSIYNSEDRNNYN